MMKTGYSGLIQKMGGKVGEYDNEFFNGTVPITRKEAQRRSRLRLTFIGLSKGGFGGKRQTMIGLTETHIEFSTTAVPGVSST